MERVQDNTILSDTLAMALMAYSIPQVINEVEAIVVFPGLGENWRIREAVRYYQNPDAVVRFFLFPGLNLREKTAESFTLERLSQPDVGLSKYFSNNIFIREHAENTLDQTEWVKDKIKERGIESLALCASPFHCLRAYLTLLKTLSMASIRIPVIPVPTKVSPNTIIPEVNQDAWSLVPGETKRIVDYQAKGDVMTLAEFKEYVSWLWKQDILR